jgi:isopenicillin-N N-acyltransferase-like protein
MSLLTNAPARYQQEIAAATKQAKLEPQVFAVANTLLELRRMGCSTLIVEPTKSATGGPLFGRNFDFPPFGVLDRYGVVFVVKPHEKRAFVSVSYPGLMGVISGMNDAGLCVATLDVYESGDGSSHFDPLGVPLTLVFRQILEECTTVDEAEALLKRTHATTQANLAVCDRDTAAVFEITPKQVARRNAAKAALPCTNHFRMPGLAVNEECWRYDRLQAAVAKTTLSVADMHQAMHAANQGEFTLQTMIFEPRELVLHLAMGTPPSSQYKMQRIELRDFLSQGK